ncbi:hypothetical protein PWT90_02891 [Aphanocladium album]|nr:hypothetical protein PWT90_02891 [Aphanocladium album]
MKVLNLAIAFLATGVIASRIKYYMRFTEGGIDGNGSSKDKAGGKIDDKHDDDVVNKMGEWSDNKYKAVKSGIVRNLITISLVKDVRTINEAVDAIADAQHILHSHINEADD